MRRLIFLTLSVLSLLTILSGRAEDTNVSNGLLPSFENAEAWNIQITKKIDLGNNFLGEIGRPAFSPDFQKLIYCIDDTKNSPPSFYNNNKSASLVIQSVKSGEILKTIKLPDLFVPNSSVACSPDGSKVVIEEPHLDKFLFVDLKTSKIISVPNKAGSASRVVWPNIDNITVIAGGSTLYAKQVHSVNLDSLAVTELPAGKNDFYSNDFPNSKYKDWLFEVAEGSDYRFHNLLVASRDHKYSKLLLGGVPGFEENDAGYISGSGQYSWLAWSPDLRYVLLGGGLFEISIRPTPVLEFEVKGLQNPQLEQMKIAFNQGKKIEADVFEPKVNPLNDKVVGPDPDNKTRGTGYIVQLEPTIKFRFTYETEKPAEFGNIISSFRSGYDLQWDVVHDDAEAFKWYKKAAEQGVVLAQANMGWMYYNGKGISKDDGEAFKWYKRAAEQGNAEGQLFIGFMYEKGYCVEKNLTEAFKWTLKAAEQGHAQAQANVSVDYLKGIGVETNNEEAFKWTEKAAKQGIADAQRRLGWMYENKFGGISPSQLGDLDNKVIAYAWYSVAAAQGWGPSIRAKALLESKMESDQIGQGKQLAKTLIP